MIAACVVYLVLAGCLFHPYLGRLSSGGYLVVANTVIAALGCFVLSRRWVDSFPASLFTGAVYGFGPFMLWLAGYHCSASFIAALVPWLFCPAAYVAALAGRMKALCSRGRPRRAAACLSPPLCALPFAAIIVFFTLAAAYRLYPLPMRFEQSVVTLRGLIAPLMGGTENTVAFGFYHVPLAPLLVGAIMMLLARRLGGILIFLLGLVLSLVGPFMNTSPAMWLSIPAVCGAVAVGIGLQGLVRAGRADAKWLFLVAVVMSVLAAAAFFQKSADLGVEAYPPVGEVSLPAMPAADGLKILTARMYLLAAAAVALTAGSSLLRLRLSLLRLVIICSACAIDIFISANAVLSAVL